MCYYVNLKLMPVKQLIAKIHWILISAMYYVSWTNMIPQLCDAKMCQVPEFEEAAFSASLNKVVRCKTQFGWHLLQVLSERYVLKACLLLISYLTMQSSCWLTLECTNLFLYLHHILLGKNHYFKTLNLRSFMWRCKIPVS